MHVHPEFAIDADEALAFARECGFGVVCAFNAGRPIAAHVPFLVKEPAPGRVTVEFHVSRANPIAACADATFDWVLVVQAPDAHASADWFVTPDHVPTLLFEAVHLTGPVRAMSMGVAGRHADELSKELERRLLPLPPWTSALEAEHRREALRNGIVGLTMQVLRVEGQRKLGRDLPTFDRDPVIEPQPPRRPLPLAGRSAEVRTLRPLSPYGPVTAERTAQQVKETT